MLATISNLWIYTYTYLLQELNRKDLYQTRLTGASWVRTSPEHLPTVKDDDLLSLWQLAEEWIGRIPGNTLLTTTTRKWLRKYQEKKWILAGSRSLLSSVQTLDYFLITTYALCVRALRSRFWSVWQRSLGIHVKISYLPLCPRERIEDSREQSSSGRNENEVTLPQSQPPQNSWLCILGCFLCTTSPFLSAGPNQFLKRSKVHASDVHPKNFPSSRRVHWRP